MVGGVEHKTGGIAHATMVIVVLWPKPRDLTVLSSWVIQGYIPQGATDTSFV